MSPAFMAFIGVCYLGAAISFAIEGKYLWAGVSLSWGIGNALIAILSK